MANCPNCGSSHIQLQRETNVNWGRAVAGWALFGIVGGAVGAVTGEDRNANACLDCGTSWKAGDLYKTLQLIQKSTGATLDLSQAKDRSYMNNFMTELTPYLNKIANKEKEGKKILGEIENKENESAGAGCGIGCLMSMSVGCSAIASSVSGGVLFLALLIPPIVCAGIGALIDMAKKQSIERQKADALRRVEAMKFEAEENYRRKVRQFIKKHYL